MKYKLLVLVVCLHLVIVAFKSFSTIGPNNHQVETGTLKKLVTNYTEYTVMQADYAFFSPDVGAAPFLKIKVNTASDSFYVPFNVSKGEEGIRLFTSLNAFNQTPDARELMARSWSAYALRLYKNANAITVSYFLKLPPTIHQFATEGGDKDTLLYQVKYQVNAE